MSAKRPRLTLAELDILLAICGFVDAGEVSGGPLDGATDDERLRNMRVFSSAWRKLQDMTIAQERAALKRAALTGRATTAEGA